MIRPSPFSVRGRRALMVMRDEREISIVRRQLSRLGMTISEHDPAEPPNQASDVILLDADSIPIKSDYATLWKGSVPIIALIGTETPSRLKWLLDLRPASFLIKPLRSAGLYTALVVAFDSAQRRVDEAAHIEKLEDRIRSRRVVLAAVLQVTPSRYVRDGRVYTHSEDCDAASHDDRGSERGNHRSRRNAEPDAAIRLALQS